MQIRGGMGRIISQEAFEEVVRENVEDLGMDPDEALADAVETLSLQGVDLSGIVKCVPGSKSVEDNPVMQSIEELRNAASSLEKLKLQEKLKEPIAYEKVTASLEKLYELCLAEGSENASIVTRNGGVELVVSLSSLIDNENERPLVFSFKLLSSIICDLQGTEKFRHCDGPRVVMNILHGGRKSSTLLEAGFAVIASASTGNEVLKESFMDLQVGEFMLEILGEQIEVQSLYSAIRVLLTPDDSRVAASQVYGYARKFADIGIADALVNALRRGASSSCFPSICSALKSIAVNDEICQSISENGGISVILGCTDEHGGALQSKLLARSCCSLLSKLAASDANKNTIVEQNGLVKLRQLCSSFPEDSSVSQEVMNVVTILSLRSPGNAARAVEAGFGDLAIQAMQKFPSSYLLQRQACLMIRNLAVRNPENRKVMLNGGVERLIRKAKGTHESCRDAATAALRDLGLDDYNA